MGKKFIVKTILFCISDWVLPDENDIESATTPPPKKKKKKKCVFFWREGGAFSQKNHHFFVLWYRYTVKAFGEDFGTKRTPPPDHKPANFRLTPATLPTIEISKIAVFFVFQGKIAIFCIQNTNSHPNCTKIIKNEFSNLLWTLKIIYILFWVCVYSVVFARFDSAKFRCFSVERFSHLKALPPFNSKSWFKTYVFKREENRMKSTIIFMTFIYSIWNFCKKLSFLPKLTKHFLTL